MVKPIDLTNKKFGRWTIISSAGSIGEKGNKKKMWRCRCECGNERIVSGSNLKAGITNSCGCLKNEQAKKRMVTHGLTNTPTYITWLNMKQRCFNHKNKRYLIYGNRGITVCKRWLTFKNFYADMGEKPEVSLTIERIDNNKGYYKENCKWGTHAEQNRNTRSNIMITHKGQTLCLRDWSDKIGVKYTTLWHRLKKNPPEIAFNL